jgi:hypothetical protein
MMEITLPPVCAVKGCDNGSSHAFKDAAAGRLFGMCDGCWAKIRVRMAERSRGQ